MNLIEWFDRDDNYILVLTSAILLFVTAVEMVFRIVRPQPLTGPFLLGLITNVPIYLGILLVTYQFRESTILSEYSSLVAQRTLAGAVLLGVLIGMFAPFVYDTWFDWFATIRWAVSIGIGGGFIAGFFNARITDQRLAAERASIRAEEARQRQELLEYLNALLRHEILNATNVILGRAEFLESQVDSDPESVDHLSTIERQGREMTEIVQDIRVLLRANKESMSFHRYDITNRIEAAIPKLKDREEAVEIELDLPDEAVVQGNELLPRAFENLFRNAIEHNDTTPARLTITGSVSDENLSVEVEDNGLGIPEDLRENLFAPSVNRLDNDSRLGTVIVGRLIKQHDGHVEVAETGPEGTKIVVTLPLAKPRTRTDEANYDAHPQRVSR